MINLKKKTNILVIGTGLSGLNFIYEYLKKNKKIDVISPNFKNSINDKKNLNKTLFKNLPARMDRQVNNIKNYFSKNKLIINDNCKIIGSLEFGGLSNYWGFQLDTNIYFDIKNLKKRIRANIINFFYHLIVSLSFLGTVKINKKKFSNDYFATEIIEKILNIKNYKYKITKPVLSFSVNQQNEYYSKLSLINENSEKLTAINFYNKFLKKKKIKLYNYVVEKISKDKKKLKVLCVNKNTKIEFTTKKLILACGTIITTKLISDFLKIKKEIKIKHHPRLMTAYFFKKKIKTKMKFTPSLIQIQNIKENFTADLRPSNKFFINSLIVYKKIFKFFKFLLYYFNDYIIFSNTLLSSKYSNLYLKNKNNSYAEIYSKKKNITKILKIKQKKIFKFLRENKVIYPFYKNLFPGYGADYHYFGTIPISKDKKKILSVNEKCQLNNHKDIYIVDGSVFNFIHNKYPLGLIMANARRVAASIKN
jgi:hypothetical protein